MAELANRRQPQNYAIETVYGTFWKVCQSAAEKLSPWVTAINTSMARSLSGL